GVLPSAARFLPLGCHGPVEHQGRQADLGREGARGTARNLHDRCDPPRRAGEADARADRARRGEAPALRSDHGDRRAGFEAVSAGRRQRPFRPVRRQRLAEV
ncbi:MAG: hypothetical protein AVDCRST_MAG04-3205, partial [uncultured Acetobacteraceae bacterium]